MPGTTSLGQWPQTNGPTLPAEKFPRMKTETVPSDLHARHVRETERGASDPECRQYQTFDQNICHPSCSKSFNART